MAIISNTDLNALLDNVCAVWLRALGTSASGYGLGDGTFGASQEATDLYNLLTSMTVPDAITAVAPASKELASIMTARERVGKALRRLLSALESHVRAETAYDSLDAYLTFLNADDSTKWQALQHWSFREVYEAWKTGTYPSPSNLYFEVVQGSTYANALRKLVVGTGETAGFSIDSSKYAGGFPKVNVSGLSGTGTVTVTGTAFDPATKSAASGKTWTASVSANGLTDLAPGGGTPAPANSLIIAASSVSVSGITAGTIYVEAHRPSGRSLPI